MAPRTIFGREPAAWVGLIEAVLAVLILLPLATQLNLTQEWAVLVMAVVSAGAGLFTAWATKDTALGAILGFSKAVLGLVGYYGLELSPELQASLMALVPILLGFFQRTQTSPLDVGPEPPENHYVIDRAVLPDETVSRGVPTEG